MVNRDDDGPDELGEVPEGAAVFPLVPEELGVHPLLLLAIHTAVFLDGSDEQVVNAPAAAEAMEYCATYLQRLSGKDLDRVREDIDTLVGWARDEKLPRDVIDFLQGFLADNGVEPPPRAK